MLKFGVPDIFHGGSIIGVAEDFHFYTLKERIKPMVMFQKHIWFWNFLIRVNDNDFQAALEHINRVWHATYPDFPLDYAEVDELYRGIYRNEIVQTRLLGIISVLTMIIACLGLVGLMKFLAGARTREIGIRKVNGASTMQVILLLYREFLLIILMAVLIGIPVSVYLIKSWLQNYVYRIGIDWWIPFLTGALFIIVSMLTITWQSRRAAVCNPVETLRYE
jgi:putative ABC transport system permease protein